MAFKPYGHFNLPFMLLVPTTTKVYGKTIKEYEETERFNARFSSLSSYETNENGLHILDTNTTIETWFNPNITADCKIKLLLNDTIYDIVSEPENMDMKNQLMKFRVSKSEGMS